MTILHTRVSPPLADAFSWLRPRRSRQRRKSLISHGRKSELIMLISWRPPTHAWVQDLFHHQIRCLFRNGRQWFVKTGQLHGNLKSSLESSLRTTSLRPMKRPWPGTLPATTTRLGMPGVMGTCLPSSLIPMTELSAAVTSRVLDKLLAESE